MTKAKKSLDPELVSWRPRSTKSGVPIEFLKAWELGEQRCSGHGLKTEERLTVQRESKVRKDHTLSSK